MLSNQSIQEADSFLRFCRINAALNDKFRKNFGSILAAKYGQLLYSQNRIEECLEVCLREVEMALENSTAKDILLTVIAACHVAQEDPEQSLHWSIKLANHKQNHVLELKRLMQFDEFGPIRIEDGNIPQPIRRPEQFSSLQRDYRGMLSLEEQFLLAQIEAAEVLAVVGQWQTKCQLYEVSNLTIF